MGNIGGAYVNSASATATVLSQSSIVVPTESFSSTLPPLPFPQHQEVSIIDFILSIPYISYQDSTVIRPPGSWTVSALNDMAPTSFPGSPNLLLISENVRTFSQQSSPAVLDSQPQFQQVHHEQIHPGQVYVAPRPNRFNDNAVTYDYTVIQRPSPPSLSSTGLSTFPSHPPDASFPVLHDPSHPSSFLSYPETASALSSSFGMSDRSDRSSSLTNTIDAIGWIGFLQQASALTTSSTMYTTDSTDIDGTHPYSEISATDPFYNWCFLQLCGVATDVGISLAEVLPLSVDQAFALSPVSRRRSLDPADRATLVHRSALWPLSSS